MMEAEFLKHVAEQRIRYDAFSLHGDRDESYVLDGSGHSWHVYYSERGLQTGRQSFDTQADAFEYLLSQLINDPTTRQHESYDA